MPNDQDPDSWWRHGVVYQIYPRSFQDSNGDGVGDLRGIINRLDWLNDGQGSRGASLGVDAIWLSPVYPSPQRDFGYDISDYDGIDPAFGTMADFDELLAQAHRRGIRVIMDLVVNHTSDQHPWFVESRSSRDNPKRDWYLWQPGVPGRGGKHRPPNNWFAGFELKSAWWLDPVTGEFYLGTFTRQQPELNWRNPAVREAIYAMMRRWLDRGVDGFRLDVANWYIKDEQLRSNPWRLSFNPPDLQVHLWDRNQPGSHEICREMRSLVAEYPGRMLEGEIFTDRAEVAASYPGKGDDELHFAFNFAFLFSPWKARAFYRRIAEWEALLPPGGWPNQTLSNHDQRRHVSRYAKGWHTEARARVAAALLLLQRGTPFLYYGEEIGMRSVRIARRDIRDPKRLMLWPLLEGRDNCRTPMQWDAGPGAGFLPAVPEVFGPRAGADHSGAQPSGAGPVPARPWLPLNPDSATRNVAAQQADPASLWRWYQTLLALRRAEPALAAGDLEWLVSGERDLLVFRRSAAGRNILVILNFATRGRKTDSGRGGTVLLGSHRRPGEPCAATIQLAANEDLVIAETNRFPMEKS